MSHTSEASEHRATVLRLWQQHLGAAFPARLRGAELDGIDMVLLDATVAGCVSTWLNNGGFLDAERHRILRDCVQDLERVRPLWTEAEDIRYLGRLGQLAVLVSRPAEQR
ncbi:hypothetical protein AB0I00_18710 [Streptomyces sp. NPDC050803]|uniref:hypothetical protein n=1 Tax=unclassified Streptomyces TaxID=2593676 RepID=UPI003449AEEA